MLFSSDILSLSDISDTIKKEYGEIWEALKKEYLDILDNLKKE